MRFSLTVKYSTVDGNRVPTWELTSEPRAHEGAQRAYHMPQSVRSSVRVTIHMS